MMTHDSSDNCGDPPSDFGTGVEFQRQRAAETAEARWERYQETDEERAVQKFHFQGESNALLRN